MSIFYLFNLYKALFHTQFMRAIIMKMMQIIRSRKCDILTKKISHTTLKVTECLIRFAAEAIEMVEELG